MATNLTAAPKQHDPPAQFTLRQAAICITVLSVTLALLSQLGTWWGLILWLIAGVAASSYPVYRSWLGFIPVGLVMSGCAVFYLMPPDQAKRNPRGDCQIHLKQIGIALHNYHDTYGSFPLAYVANKQGRPMHSWRVLILPFLEQEALYKRYDFNEPWDGPNNSKLVAEMPRIYRCPSDSRSASPTDTSYVAVIGRETAWPGASAVSLGDITDGASNTILVVESHGSGINWMEPRDLHTLQMPATVNPINGQGICSCHNECVQVAFADGSVRTLKNGVPSTTIRALLTTAGGETVQVP